MIKLLLALALGLSPLVAHGEVIYSGKAIEGMVIDRVSKQPIEGAVVVASWELYRAKGFEGGERDTLKQTQVVTDAAGRFFIPGWGPRIISPLWNLEDETPSVVAFKPGMRPMIRSGHPAREKKLVTLEIGAYNSTERLDQQAISLLSYRGSLCKGYWRPSAPPCSGPLEEFFKAERARLLASGLHASHLWD